MKNIILSLSLLIYFNVCNSQTIYTFNGNGYWNIPSNWANNTIPPNVLPNGSSIIISTTLGDSCVLNISQTISRGAGLTVSPGSNFIVKQNLQIFDSSNNPTITICNQMWMGKNLNVGTYRNGDVIPKVTDDYTWTHMTTGAYCYYNNDSATYASIYGKLYNYYAVTDPRGLAPSGWHVPTTAEWSTFTACLGGSLVAGGAVKDTGVIYWKSPNAGATNSSGFTALPGGYRTNVGTFSTPGIYCQFWSSTEFDPGNAYGRRARYDDSTFSSTSYVKVAGYSVRCIKD